MRVLIATPLFPPDIADPAPYIKELAARLSDQHTVSILCYGTIPEDIPGVTFSVVKKHWPTVLRLAWCTVQLWWHSRRADVVLIENGPSTELPALLVSFVSRRRFLLQLSDTKVQYRGMATWIHRQLRKRVSVVITPQESEHATTIPLPLPRPEILPFASYPYEAIATYESSWKEHIVALNSHLTQS